MGSLQTREYLTSLELAHGCAMPTVTSTYVGWEDRTLLYDVCLVDWQVTVRVPMPDLGVLIHLSLLHTSFAPELPREHAEFYIDRYQVRAMEALSFALADFDEQPADVQRHLVDRFGPMLDDARAAGAKYWGEVLESSRPT